MWVHNPHKDEFSLLWGGERYALRYNVPNEVPEDVARAYFIVRMPSEVMSNEQLYKESINICLDRWKNANPARFRRPKAPTVGFVESFMVTDTRDELEKEFQKGKASA